MISHEIALLGIQLMNYHEHVSLIAIISFNSLSHLFCNWWGDFSVHNDHSEKTKKSFWIEFRIMRLYLWSFWDNYIVNNSCLLCNSLRLFISREEMHIIADICWVQKGGKQVGDEDNRSPNSSLFAQRLMRSNARQSVKEAILACADFVSYKALVNGLEKVGNRRLLELRTSSMVVINMNRWMMCSYPVIQ